MNTKIAFLLSLFFTLSGIAGEKGGGDTAFQAADGSISNKKLYESLLLKEKLVNTSKSDGMSSGKKVMFTVSENLKKIGSIVCKKRSHMTKDKKGFSNYTCEFGVSRVNFAEKNKVRKKHWVSLVGNIKDKSIAQVIFENTGNSSVMKSKSYDGSITYKIKSFGQYKVKETTYSSGNQGYSFFMEL